MMEDYLERRGIKLTAKEFAFQRKIINLAVKKILESKLLLDEDNDVILSYWRLNIMGETDQERRYRMLSGVLAAVGLMANVKEKNLVMGALLSIPISYIGVKGAYEQFKTRYYNSLFDDLISSFGEVFNFIRSVKSYFKQRENYFSKLKASTDEHIYKLMRGPDLTFAANIHEAFKGAAAAAQAATKENCEGIGMCSAAYMEICIMNLKKYQFTLSDLGAAIENVQHEYCLMMSSFLGSLVVKFSIEIEHHDTFYKTMHTTVKTLIKALKLTLKQKEKFSKVQQLHRIKTEEVVRTRPNVKEINMKRIEDVMVYFQTGFDLTNTLEKSIESDKGNVGRQIKCIIDHLKLAGIQVDALESILPKETVKRSTTDVGEGSHMFTNTRPSQSGEVICYDDPDEEREDEEFECSLLAETQMVSEFPLSSYGYDDSSQKDVLTNRSMLIAELNNRLSIVRRERELKKRSQEAAAPPVTETQDQADGNQLPCSSKIKNEPVLVAENQKKRARCDADYSLSSSTIKKEAVPAPQNQDNPSVSRVPMPPPLPAAMFDEPPRIHVTSHLTKRYSGAVAVAAAQRARREMANEQVFVIGDSSDEEVD